MSPVCDGRSINLKLEVLREDLSKHENGHPVFFQAGFNGGNLTIVFFCEVKPARIDPGTSSCHFDTNYTLSTVGTCQCLYVSHCPTPCQALKTWRTMWSGYFEANLLALGGEAGHPCSCRLGGWPIQTTHLQTISSSFVGDFPARPYRSRAEWPLLCRYQREIEQVVLQQISLIHWCAGCGGSLW